jgi:hypothetical protein
MGTGTALLLLTAFQVTFLTFTPMSWWVEYIGATVIGHGNSSLVYINRKVYSEEPVPIRVFAELHGLPKEPLQLDQYCEGSNVVTAEHDTGPLVIVPVRDVLRPGCNFYLLPCVPMQLQLVMELELPFSIKKRKRFISEPFYPTTYCMITDGGRVRGDTK